MLSIVSFIKVICAVLVFICPSNDVILEWYINDSYMLKSSEKRRLQVV